MNFNSIKVLWNKVYIITKILLFIENNKRELWMRTDIKIKDKIRIITEFVKRMRKMQEKY